MESIHWEPEEKLDGVGSRGNWENAEETGERTSSSGSRFLDENWTTSLVRRIKERLRWEDVEEEKHLYEDLDGEEKLHPDIRIYFAYLEKYC